MHKTLAVCVIAAVLTAAPSGQAALIPSAFIDSVVAIGSIQSRDEINSDKKVVTTEFWRTEGTGFLYAYLDKTDLNGKNYRTFLVTARHVVKSHAPNTPMQMRINSLNPSLAPNFELSTYQTSAWFFEDNENERDDVAILPLDIGFLQRNGLRISFFTSDLTSEDRGMMIASGLSVGDGIFVLGFPLGITGATRNFVIAKQGIVAKLSDYLQSSSDELLIDALIDPGNSGGPVVLRPEVTSLVNTPPQLQSKLIGVVVSYLESTDVAVSQQSHATVIFQNNSGLANVIPVDTINQLILKWEAVKVQTAPVQPNRVEPEQPAGQQPAQSPLPAQPQ